MDACPAGQACGCLLQESEGFTVLLHFHQEQAEGIGQFV